MNFNDMIFYHAVASPRKPAMAMVDRLVTYEMVAHGILCFAARLERLQFPAGAVVAVEIENPLRHVIAVSALYRSGIISVSIDEIGSISASGLSVATVLSESSALEGSGFSITLVDDDWFYGDQSVITAVSVQRFTNDDVCRIFMSSGTTGTQKPLAASTAMLQQRMYTRLLTSASTANDRVLVLPSLSSQIGWTSVIGTFWCGGLACLALIAEVALQTAGFLAATSIICTANQLRDLVRIQEQAYVQYPSLQLVQTGGGFISDQLMRKAQTLLCNRILCRYGSTEAGVAAMAQGEALIGITGAVGFVAPFARIEIIEEDGKSGLGGGLLRISTGAHYHPYHPGITEIRTSPEEWFYPGDIGKILPDGMLVITGRATEVINIGGAKISPTAIEQFLTGEPGLKDIAAVGVIGESGIEEVWLALVGDETLNADKLAERLLNSDDIYGTVKAKIVTLIPRNAAGKILRDDVRRLLTELI